MQIITTTSHTTLARFTLAKVSYAIATEDILHNGMWHDAVLSDDAKLGENWAENVLRGDAVRLTFSMRKDLSPAGVAVYQAVRDGIVDGLSVTVETLTRVTWADGTASDSARVMTLTVTGRQRNAGTVTLTLSDLEDTRLNTLYPSALYTVAQWPGLSPLDEGRAIPHLVGVVEKVPMARLTNVAPWRFSMMRRADGGNAGGTVIVPAIYRGSGPSDARVITGGTQLVIDTFTHRVIDYTQEQRDFSGAEYRLFSDISSSVYTAPQVIRLLLTHAGVTVDNTSFTACEAWAATEGLLVDCDFGCWGQRTTRAILEDLLYVARATLCRLADGSYGIVWDGAATAFSVYNEDAGDPIEIISHTESAQPSKVGVRYRPATRDPANALQFTQMRDVPNGTQGEQRPRELRYIRRHEVADKTAYYYAQRAAHSQRLKLRVYRTTHTVGDTMRITSSAYGLTASDWRVRRVNTIVGGVELECERYSSALVTYVAGTLQGEAGADYTPDYSNTPPSAPTGLRITADAVAIAGDGATTARVTVDAIPPAANAARLQFSVVHNTTGEIVGILQGTPDGAGREAATFTGLRPGETYKLLCWAENNFNIQGAVQGTFDATAIGGSATATTFVSAGYATLPANVTGIVATQGMGRLVNVSWNAVTTSNLREYVLERRIGTGAYAEIWRGQTRSYIDRDVAYGSAFQYRIRARDLWGNFSAAYATSTAITLTAGTITGGVSAQDIGLATVASSNRTNVTTVSATGYGPTLSGLALTIPHSLGRVPICSANTAGKADAWANVRSATATQINVSAFAGPVGMSEEPGTSWHEHSLMYGSGNVTISVDIY